MHCDQKKNQVIYSKTDLLEISSKGLYLYITQLLIRLKFSDYVRSQTGYLDQTKFLTDLEDKTECLLSLEKFMQIRSQTEVWSKN